MPENCVNRAAVRGHPFIQSIFQTMRKRILFPSLFLLLATAVVAQPKFRNGRFANITPVAIKLVDAGEFYSEPTFSQVADEMALVFKAADLDFIRSKSVESALPPALNSLDKRNANRPAMLDYKLYELARFDAAGLVVCVAPVAENQHMKDRNMIGADDLILTFSTKAFGGVEAAIETDETPAAPSSRPDIDYKKVKVKTLAEALRLKMPDGDGTNGAAVAWHPDLEMYFSAFAGNSTYPMAVFNKKGERISAVDIETGFDPRGFWFDTQKSQVWGNGYDDYGWYRLDVSKRPAAPEAMSIVDGMVQPEANSVGVYDPVEKGVAFFDAENTELRVYDVDKFEEKSLIPLHPGITDPKAAAEHALGPIPEGYNATTALSLGGRKTAFGLFHVGDRQLECYDRATGMLTEVWKLPEVKFDLPDRFNMAYANGMLFLFDIGSRTWVGYK